MYQLHLVATLLFSLIFGANAWSYKDAKNWGKKYPKCDGKNQSPVIFNSYGKTVYPEYKETLRLKDFDKLPKKLTITNDGHTVEMKGNWTGAPPSCTGGPLHGNYVFEKATFHWAQKKWCNEKYPVTAIQGGFMQDLEMHMYFYNEKFKSYEKASTKKGGLAAFSMGFKGGNHDTDHAFDDLAKSLHKVRSPNSTAEINPFLFATTIFDTSTMFPFYYYEGSLDNPPCSESVSWFILENSYVITQKLVDELRKIKLAEGDVSNVRPHQALNKRKVMMVNNHDGDEPSYNPLEIKH